MTSSKASEEEASGVIGADEWVSWRQIMSCVRKYGERNARLARNWGVTAWLSADEFQDRRDTGARKGARLEEAKAVKRGGNSLSGRHLELGE